MKYIFLTIMCLFLAPVTAIARDGGNETWVRQVASAGGRLWLLTGDGLVSFTEKDHLPRPENAGGDVSDMCSLDGVITVLTRGAEDTDYTLRHYDHGRWIDQAHISGVSAYIDAMVCDDHGVDILTAFSVISIRSGRVTTTRVDGDIHHGYLSVLGTSDTLYVGIIGEYGGGLQVIDRGTGLVHTIDKRGEGECEGPLNLMCDPVRGLAIIPWQPDCLALAIGRWGEHGRITEACADKIVARYTKPLADTGKRFGPPYSEPYGTMSFSGLDVSRGKLIATGTDGLYKMSADGKVTFSPWPKFRKVGPYRVSFADPDVVLVMVTTNDAAPNPDMFALMVGR